MCELWSKFRTLLKSPPASWRIADFPLSDIFTLFLSYGAALNLGKFHKEGSHEGISYFSLSITCCSLPDICAGRRGANRNLTLEKKVSNVREWMSLLNGMMLSRKAKNAAMAFLVRHTSWFIECEGILRQTKVQKTTDLVHLDWRAGIILFT